MKKKLLTILLALSMCFSLVACASNKGQDSNGSSDSSAEKKEIKLGCLATFEPYIDILVEKLNEKGYDAELVLFDENNMAAIACKDGDIDGFIHNHLPWIKTFNEENGSDLTMVEPHLGYYRFAMYSLKYKSIDEIPDGATIAVANDSNNLQSSLLLLQEAGLLKLGEKTDNFYSTIDIIENPKNIKLLETEISTTARSIEDADAVLCPSTRIKLAGYNANDFIVEDETMVNNPVGLTMRTETVDAQWVKDAVEIMKTQEMKDNFDKIFEGTVAPYEY